MKKKKKPTLKDIAKKANVSIGTVDRAMHNRGRIAPEVQERVLQIAKDLGYKKNIYASLLASKRKTRKVAYLLPNEGQDAYWDLVINGVLKSIENKPIDNIIFKGFSFDPNDAEDFLSVVELIREEDEIEVLLITPIFGKEWEVLLEILAKKKIYYLIINTLPQVLDDHFIGYIGPDSFQSGMLAGRLMHYHCKNGDKVLFMPLEKNYTNARHMIDKKDGFFNFFQSHAPNTEVIISDFEEFNVEGKLSKYLQDLLKDNPDISGLYASASRTHIVAKALLDIDKEIILIGHDTLPENVKYLKQGIIHYLINQNPYLMGYLGMKTCQEFSIYGKLDKKKVLMHTDIIVPENYQKEKGGFVSFEMETLSMIK